jgi:hypothetical protein
MGFLKDHILQIFVLTFISILIFRPSAEMKIFVSDFTLCVLKACFSNTKEFEWKMNKRPYQDCSNLNAHYYHFFIFLLLLKYSKVNRDSHSDRAKNGDLTLWWWITNKIVLKKKTFFVGVEKTVNPHFPTCSSFIRYSTNLLLDLTHSFHKTVSISITIWQTVH